MPDPRSEYIARLNQVIDDIDAHLDGPLTLEMLAGVACFSPFHFHRLFKSLAGETLSDSVWRIRLEKAANWLLAGPGISIIEISQACGFSSPAVFSRFQRPFWAEPAPVSQAQQSAQQTGQRFSSARFRPPSTRPFNTCAPGLLPATFSAQAR